MIQIEAARIAALECRVKEVESRLAALEAAREGALREAAAWFSANVGRLDQGGAEESADDMLLALASRPEPAPAPPRPQLRERDRRRGRVRARGESVRDYVVRICDGCRRLEGKMCSTPGCAFCFRSMPEVAAVLDATLLRPVVDGERLDLMALVEPTPSEPESGGTTEHTHALLEHDDGVPVIVTNCPACRPASSAPKDGR